MPSEYILLSGSLVVVRVISFQSKYQAFSPSSAAVGYSSSFETARPPGIGTLSHQTRKPGLSVYSRLYATAPSVVNLPYTTRGLILLVI